ncbi:hypothetical protein ABEW34_29660 [Paenibacillus algorifonticola]|uniref:hypothetical protein n=1 Tax=Paenibacillus algorifonticola TaxID=684063 RepID=UPI003D27EC2E
MYLDEAIVKINSVKWDAIGTNVSKADVKLAQEFLRRLAQFFKEELIKPRPPLFSNIAQLLGDNEEEIVISNYCSEEASKFLGRSIYTGKVFEYYIQLSKYVDEHQKAIKYLNVYEPLIKIIERGGLFDLRHQSLEIQNVGHMPLSGWFEKFVTKEPIDIDTLI